MVVMQIPSSIKIKYIINALPAILKLAEKDKDDYKININKLKKILNIKSSKEIKKLIDTLILVTINDDGAPDDFLSIDYESDDEIFFLSSPILEKLKTLTLPLTLQEWEILGNLIKNNERLLRKLLPRLSGLVIEDSDTNFVEEIKNKISNAISENKEMLILYKKTNPPVLEEKQILPLKILNTNYSSYLYAYDVVQKKEKTFRIDRIVKINNFIKSSLRISFDENKINDLEMFRRDINKNTFNYVFAYDPKIEMNLRNRLDIKLTDQKIIIKDQEWKIARYYTIFPDSFFENIIPFLNLTYFLEPKEMNQKIIQYLKKIYNQI